MKNACNKYNIPVITISQNNRGSSDEDRELDIGSLGDSWKKARFADNLIMVRKRDSLDIFSENVKKDIYRSSDYNNKALTFDEDNSFDDDSFSQDHSKLLIPFELKIVKAKDGDKSGSSRFMLFSKKNLRIYDKFEDYIDDYKKAFNPNKEIQKNISLLTSTETISLNEIDNIVDDDDDEDSSFVVESDIEDIDFEI